MSIEQDFIPCNAPMCLPDAQQLAAAEEAIRINPKNAPMPMGGVWTPQKIAVIVSKWWGDKGVNLGVAFLDTNDATLKAKILFYMNKWNKWCNAKFTEASRSIAEIRISRGPGGYYSYLGSDCLSIPKNQQTMNLEGFSLSTPDSEFDRVVTHETGHAMGCPHEHARPEVVARLDFQKTLAYFQRTQGWTAEEVMQQVLTPLNVRSIRGTPNAEDDSIMCYQLPGAITKDGRPIIGGTKITDSDGAFMGKVYPKTESPPPSTGLTVPAVLAVNAKTRDETVAKNPQYTALLTEYTKRIDTAIVKAFP